MNDLCCEHRELCSESCSPADLLAQVLPWSSVAVSTQHRAQANNIWKSQPGSNQISFSILLVGSPISMVIFPVTYQFCWLDNEKVTSSFLPDEIGCLCLSLYKRDWPSGIPGQRPGGKSGARKMYAWWKRIRSGNALSKLPWALEGCTHEC